MDLLHLKIHHLQENPTENLFKREQIHLSNEPSTDHGPNEPIRFRPKVDQQWFWPHSGWKKTTLAEAFQDGCTVDLTWNHSKNKFTVGRWVCGVCSRGSSSSCFLSQVNGLTDWLPPSMLWISWDECTTDLSLQHPHCRCSQASSNRSSSIFSATVGRTKWSVFFCFFLGAHDLLGAHSQNSFAKKHPSTSTKSHLFLASNSPDVPWKEDFLQWEYAWNRPFTPLHLVSSSPPSLTPSLPH